MEQSPRRFNNVINEVYGMDFVNAKRVINTKIKQQKPNPENLTLAERILLNRKRGDKPSPRRDSPAGSVDISDLTNQNDERRTPTPEPTRRKTPVRRQDTRRSIASEKPGPSNRKSETPPLPPIKSASPKSESKSRTPTRQSKVEPRRDTPVLPPIVKSRASTRSEHYPDDIQPPKDRRHFDPNIGVGDESDGARTPEQQQPVRSEAHKTVTPVPVRQEKPAEQETINRHKTPVPVPVKTPDYIRQPPTPKPKTPVQENPKSPEKRRAPSAEKARTVTPQTAQTIVPVVVAAAANQRSRTRSRTRSRSRSRSRRRSRSKSKERSRKRRSKSRKRSRSRRRSRSSSRSHSRRRSRRRHRSYSSSSSPRRRRYSTSPGTRRHKSRGRSRSRRRSFDYDFERAKSIVRGISRMQSFSQVRHRSPSVEYQYVGGNSGYWPPQRRESPKRKKKIIIVQNGPVQQKSKRRSNSSSDSDIDVVVKNTGKSKSRGKKSKVRKVSDTEDSDSGLSRSRSRHRKGKGKKVKIKNQVSDSSESDDSELDVDIKVKKTKNSKKNTTKKKINKKNESNSDESTPEETKKIRFNLDNVEKRKVKTKKSIKVEADDEPEPEPELEEKENNVPRFTAQFETEAENKSAPRAEQQKDVRAGNRPQKPPSPNKAPPTTGKGPAKPKKNNDKDLLEALEQLDKRADFEIDQLKGGNQRKLPPDVNLEMKKKIFSPEFQNNINRFLES